MEGKEARRKLLKLFNSSMKFNKEFDENILRLKEGMADDLIEWCKRCSENKELGSVPQKKEFKNLYIFFRKIASDMRVTLIKQQNKDFIEIRLEDHKRYDDTRVKFGYKKSSYYGS